MNGHRSKDDPFSSFNWNAAASTELWIIKSLLPKKQGPWYCRMDFTLGLSRKAFFIHIRRLLGV